MRRLATALLALAPLASTAAEPAPAGPPPASGGLTASASLGGGAELGLESGKAGLLELEAVAGYEIESVGVRPEIAAALGLAPDGHVALRPGVRWTIPGFPIQLRAAFDASNSRRSNLHWRWLLIGAAAEIRFTGLLGFFGEIDTGAPLASGAGLPLLVRAGASFRF
ncbi:MAG TPA: hypothetical protein VIV57_20685 [Anaeromyxobacter sp.]